MEKDSLSPELRSQLAASWTGTIRWDVDMAGYCTFRTGGRAEAVLTASDEGELAALMPWLRSNKVSWRVIGLGSNILVQSGGFKGVMIILGGDFNAVACVEGPTDGARAVSIRVGAGCSVARLVNWCTRHEMSGLEFMAGIPGSVGGAVRMNAGAWGSEIGDRLESISYADQDGRMHDASRDKLDISYRHLGLVVGMLDAAVVTGAVLRMKPGREDEIAALCRKYLEMRKAKQPLGVASAGSFFKNPPGDSAGRLIDDAGLKGLRRGNAMVSTKHANFLINTGQATADDIVELMQEVQRKVYLHSGVMLEPEVQLL